MLTRMFLVIFSKTCLIAREKMQCFGCGMVSKERVNNYQRAQLSRYDSQRANLTRLKSISVAHLDAI